MQDCCRHPPPKTTLEEEKTQGVGGLLVISKDGGYKQGQTFGLRNFCQLHSFGGGNSAERTDHTNQLSQIELEIVWLLWLGTNPLNAIILFEFSQ